MRFAVTADVFALFPRLVIGVVMARDLRNSASLAAVAALLRETETRAVERLGAGAVVDHPHVSAWREAYRAFGAKPKEHPSSIESLLRRVCRGQQLRPINTLVDLYNIVSLRHFVPVGGEDLDEIRGDILLTRAGPAEPPAQLLGESESRPPHPGEVIYRDDAGAICRRFNWKEAERTRLTEQTRNAVMVLEGLPPVDERRIVEAMNDLAELIRQWCGGILKTALMTSAAPELVL